MRGLTCEACLDFVLILYSSRLRCASSPSYQMKHLEIAVVTIYKPILVDRTTGWCAAIGQNSRTENGPNINSLKLLKVRAFTCMSSINTRVRCSKYIGTARPCVEVLKRGCVASLAKVLRNPSGREGLE